MFTEVTILIPAYLFASNIELYIDEYVKLKYNIDRKVKGGINMSKEFNKQQMLDNITFFLQEFSKKIGELETEAGVSPGYISRITKDEKTKPGIDFIVKTADALNVSVDTLLNADFSEMTPTERYLVKFIEKLIRDTQEDKLDWDREANDILNRMEPDINGYVSHPMLSYETFMEEGETEYPDEVSRTVFISKSFGVHTYIDNDCYNLRMKNDAVLYVMSISKSVHRTNDKNAYAKEVWMCTPGARPQFLCYSKDRSVLGTLVDTLYLSISENAKHPKVKDSVRYAIDAFMDDDLEDDPEYIEAVARSEMPF